MVKAKITILSDLKYLWECKNKERYHRYHNLFKENRILDDSDLFFNQKPHCKFWVAYDKDKGYEIYQKEFGGKRHNDWCIYSAKDKDEKPVKDILRDGISDIGDRLHWKCHHIPHIIEERIDDILELKDKLFFASQGVKDLDTIRVLIDLHHTQEHLKRHYQEFMNYRFVFNQHINIEENKKDRAGMVILTIIAMTPFIIGLGVWISQYILTIPFMAISPIEGTLVVSIIPVLIFLYCLYSYKKSAVKVHELKDAMYLCLGIDEDVPEQPAGIPEPEEKVIENLLKKAEEEIDKYNK